MTEARSLDARLVERLELEEAPAGAVSHWLVTLTHDAMGRAVRAPVLVARGTKPGPVCGITAALHGDELNGIRVVHRLFDRLEPERIRGAVVAVAVANLPGYLARERGFTPDGSDLNHLMPGRADGDMSEVYVHRLLDRVVGGFEHLVDLHTASPGRVNSLYVRADMTDERTARMAYLQRPQIILHNPANDTTLRGAAMAMGIPAITVEIGDPQRFQPEYIRKAVLGLRAVLGELGVIPRQRLAMGAPPILCARSYWIYTDHGGLLDVFPELVERVEKGAPIARLTDIFGRIIREYAAPEAGVVIGKSVNPPGGTGARILHLGIPADAEEHFQLRPDMAPEGGDA